MELFNAFVCIFLAAATAAEPPAKTPEQKAVEATAQAFVTAFDKGDAAAVAALWTPTGEYATGSQTLKGRAAIQKAYEEFFKAHPGSKMQMRIDAVHSVAPNVAIEEGVATVTNSANGPDSASSYSAVHVNQNGQWLMASVRESDVPLQPAADLQQLAWLVGDWSVTGEEARVDVKYEWLANQNFLRAETSVRPKDETRQALHGGMQIIGLDRSTGQIVSWFFDADGGHGTGAWINTGTSWLVQSQGATADGVPTTATNIIRHPHDDVMSWQSVDRSVGGEPLPNREEIVLDRVKATTTKAATK